MDVPDSLHSEGDLTSGRHAACASAIAAVVLHGLAAFVVLFLLSSVVSADVRDSFEGPDNSWQLADHDCTLRLLQHRRALGQAHSGQASEHVQFYAGSGSYVHLVSPVAASPVIDELSVSIWVKANRRGVQLAMRVVLPRSRDPRTGGVLTTLIRGSSYGEAETWKKLTIESPRKLVDRQVPLLRSQFGSDVDARGAYVDLLVLNVYGGTGETDVWLDDLEISGQVDSPSAGGDTADRSARGAVPLAEELSTAGNRKLPVLDGSVFLIDGYPQLVRAIDSNGEPFAWLKSLGFNAICLPTPPTAEQLQEAEESGIWLIAPPPPAQSPPQSAPLLDQILAWDLGRQLTSEQVEPTRRRALELRSVADDERRPTLCLPAEDVWQYSRVTDLTVLEPPGPQQSLSLRDYGRWYRTGSQRMQMGTHFWASIRTQISPRVVEQMTALGASQATASTLEPDQIRLLTYHAIASGARGLIFRSMTPLNDTDALTQLRAKTLERLNRELTLLEPWAATGRYDGDLETGDPSVRVSVLKIERSRLLLVIRCEADQQYVTVSGSARPISFEVPGVPDTDEAYEAGEDGLRRMPQQRGTGVRVRLENPRLITRIVLTQDQQVINFLARQTAALRHAQDQLLGEIAAQLYGVVVETHQQLLQAAPIPGLTNAAPENAALSQARVELQQFQQLLEGGGHERAYQFLQRGMHQLAVARYQEWKAAVSAFSSPVASPFCVSYFSLPEHYALGQRLRGKTWGPNSLPGGDFENLSVLQSSGWKNVTTQTPEVNTTVELSLHAPRAGRSSLRLQCWPVGSDTPPQVLSGDPVSITTAPLPLTAGQIVRIHGFARAASPTQGSSAGLRIYDSFTGEDLAEHIQQTREWYEFTLYRAAPRSESLTVTFALSGIGEAWLDDVSIHLLNSSPSQAQLPSSADAAISSPAAR